MRRPFARLMLAIVIAGGGLAAAAYWTRPAAIDETRLSWIATAHQLGPVGYRDPAGAVSPDGKWIAYSEGRFLRVRPIDGGATLSYPPGDAQIRNLAWSDDSRTIFTDGAAAPTDWAAYDRASSARTPIADGKDRAAALRRACVQTVDGRSRITLPCGGRVVSVDPDRDAYGSVAVSADGRTVYGALANDRGTVDLWSIPAAGGRARQLTAFSRDSYAPTVAVDGSVVFKVQSYRTFVAAVPATGGASRQLALFQSETPSWDPSGRAIGVTFGTWRRVVDDARYPDIAQDAGIIAIDLSRPAERPASIVHASVSEDQALCWSPNRRWIAFHSHKDQSDDIWLRPAADGVEPRRISFLGRGAEAGWPRWSPDGKWLLFDGDNRTTRRSVMWVAGMDQETGSVTSPPAEIAIDGLDAQISHAEWLPDSEHVVALAKEGPGRHVIFTASRSGGTARIVHRVASEHDAPGLAASPDGRHVAFIAPAPDGFFQVHRIPIAGGPAVLVTTDPSNKTQPAWSPDGSQIAFTVWSYEAQFWRLR